MLRLRIILLLCLVTGALTQDLFDLSDALDDVKPATPKPEQPKAPEKPKDDGGFGFNLDDALGPDTPKPAKPTVKPPKSGGGGGFEFNLDDALGPDANPPKPTVKPPNRGGGGEANPGYNSHGGAADEPQDPDLLWGQILKMLNANMPEEFFMWMSNLKQILAPLLERAMDLLQAIP
ncbi:CD99 molecule isoform X2 [Epinephelus fuscoguttatus]|uniref:CD99 molecule isoform X2 n=1 Tax=Epinephelus fuscoguttatus TaxID=293821 RepID=UPI0020D10E48|nr:CD99 molecule isoform X2 [Epinephelus fuscoguttatus]